MWEQGVRVSVVVAARLLNKTRGEVTEDMRRAAAAVPPADRLRPGEELDVFARRFEREGTIRRECEPLGALPE
jgi:hypothetical protein